MSENIKLLYRGLNVTPIHWNLQNHPELWDRHTARTADPHSPHHGLSDIWARFGDDQNAVDGTPHDAKWYPEANLLNIKQLCHELMYRVGGVELGGVLITRIPPGGVCKPHQDTGWHALRYEKFGVQITSAPGQKFCFEDGELETIPGDVFWFKNQPMHWVVNPTKYERITMIVCIRFDNCEGVR